MHKYLISLDKDQARRELFFSQAGSADFQIFSAINTMNRDAEELHRLFAMDKFAAHYGRQVTKGEIGCTLSHLGVYQLIVADETIAEDEFALICEDDALFSGDDFDTVCAQLALECKSDILLIGQSKIATFADSELEINYPTTFSWLRQHCGAWSYAYPYKSYFAGTVAYLIKKSAARKMLSQTNQPYWLADDFPLFDSWGISNQVLRPLLVIENPRLASNLEGARGSIQATAWKQLLKYPLKKVMAVKRNLRK